MRPSGSVAVAEMAIVAGNVYRAPVAGEVTDTTGGPFAELLPVILTLSRTAVVLVLTLWLVTARPTYTVFAIGMVSDPIRRP